MDFGTGHTANAGAEPGTMSECVFADGEYIHTVQMTEATWGDSDTAPAGFTFSTPLQTCGRHGPAGIKTTTYTGHRLLFIKGRVGALFDQFEMVFNTC